MTKKQENIAFAKMLKEFPKAFGRVSFRERLMLRTAFTYVVEEIVEQEIKQLGERCNQLLKDKGDLKDNYDQFKAVAEDEIERLKKENEELRNNGFTVSAMTEQQLKIAIEKGEQLEKENAELEATIADLEATNKRISDECHKLVGSLEKIQKENAELKENYRKRGKVIISLEKQIRLYIHSDKLTKAKEIIKELLLLPYANNEEVYTDVTSTLDKAEQFLKEIEK